MSAKDGEFRGFDLERDGLGRLVLVGENAVEHVGVVPVRGFPISDPDHWISICDADGRELVLVKDVAALTEVRAVLEADLARREFVPRIRRILRMPTDTEPTEWEVETDRGPTRFVLNSNDDVRRLGKDRALIIDSQGIRYQIDDPAHLDPLSRRVLERYL